MTFEEKMKFNPTVEEIIIRQCIQDLLEMENKEEKFEKATRIWKIKQNPPLSYVEWKIICEIGDCPGFEKIFFQKAKPDERSEEKKFLYY